MAIIVKELRKSGSCMKEGGSNIAGVEINSRVDQAKWALMIIEWILHVRCLCLSHVYCLFFLTTDLKGISYFSHFIVE